MTVGPPMLPVSLRRPAGLVAGTAALIFGVLATRYASDSSARWLDRRLQWLVGATGPARSISDVVIVFGGPLAVVVLAGLIGGTALALGHGRLALLAIVGPGLTGLAIIAFKPVIGRTFNGEFAYPSGHAAGATALGIVATLLLISFRSREARTTAGMLVLGAVLSGGTMSFALIADRDHYPTDTIGGFCVAVAVVLASTLVIEWLVERTAGDQRP